MLVVIDCIVRLDLNGVDGSRRRREFGFVESRYMHVTGSRQHHAQRSCTPH
jgi:hypothetical protein